MDVQERLQHLIQELPEADLIVAERMLRGLKLTQDEGDDPLLVLLDNCPEDDEPYTDDEQQADEDAWVRYQHGNWVPHEEVFGSTRTVH